MNLRTSILRGALGVFAVALFASAQAQTIQFCALDSWEEELNQSTITFNGDTIWNVGDPTVIYPGGANSCSPLVDIPTQLANNGITGGAAGDYTVTIGDSYGDGGHSFTVDPGALACSGECGGSFTSGSSATWSFTLAEGVFGCTDETALNYDAEATIDDGSCVADECPDAGLTMVYMNVYDSYGDGWNGATWTVNSGGVAIATGGLEAGNFAQSSFCLPDDACYTVSAGGGDWDGEISYEIVDVATGAIVASSGFPLSGGGAGTTQYYSGDTPEVCGCTDDTALNYDPEATVDNGGCVSSECPEGFTLMRFDMENPNQNAAAGWYGTTYTVTSSSGELVASGSLDDATFPIDPLNGYDVFCLASDDCYTLEVSGGLYPGDKEWVLSEYFTGTVLYEAQDGDGFGTFGISGPGIVCGCTNPSALNYDETATSDDGLCFAPDCENDPDSTSYILTLTHDYYTLWGGNALYIYDASTGDTLLAAGTIDGTMEPDYPISAVENLWGFCVPNDACLVLSAGGGATFGTAAWFITDFDGNEYHAGQLGVFDVGFGTSADACLSGCTIDNAINYDPEATTDDGSCVFCANGQLGFELTLFDEFAGSWEADDYFLINEDGDTVLTGTKEEGSVTDVLISCLDIGCYTFSTGGGLSSFSEGWGIEDNTGQIYAPLTLGPATDFPIAFGLTGAGVCGFSGCTSELAINYNPSADVDDNSCLFPPPNDTPETAQPLPCGVPYEGSLENATTDEFNGTTILGLTVGTSPGVWYTFNSFEDQQVSFSTCASGDAANPISDTKMFVFQELTDGTLVPVGANDDATCGFLSEVSINAYQGENYLIRVGKYLATSSGTGFVIEATCSPCPDGFPENDDLCTLALPLVDGAALTGSLCCAASDDNYGLSGVSIFATTYGIWYEVDVDAATYNLYNVTVDATGSGAIGYGIYSADDCTTLTDEASGVVQGSFQTEMDAFSGAEVTGPATAAIENPAVGETFYVYIWTTEPAECGTFTVMAEAEIVGCTDASANNYDPTATVLGTCNYVGIVQPNDSCSNAIGINCGESLAGNTGGSTAAGGTDACGNAANGVWYEFMNNNVEQLVTVSTCGSASPNGVSVFEEISNPDATLAVNSLNSNNYQNISAVITLNGDTIADIPAGDLFPTVFNDYYLGLSGGDYVVYFTNEGDELDGISAEVLSSTAEPQTLICSGTCSTEPSVCLDLAILSDTWASETSFELTDGGGNEVLGGTISSGLNNFSVCVPPGSYTFTIFDSYGDGICCVYGNGYYELSGPDGILASGGEFGGSESTSFTLEASPFNLPAGGTLEQAFTILGGTGLCSSLICGEGSEAIVSEEACDNGESYQFISSDAAEAYAILVGPISGSQGGEFTLSVDCEPVVYGCQDAQACNYNSAANVDDPNDPCDFLSCVDCPAENLTYCYPDEDEWEVQLVNPTGENIILVMNNGLEISTFSGNTWDDLVIYDGPAAGGIPLYDSDSGLGDANDADILVVSTNDTITITFDSDFSVSCDDPSFADPADLTGLDIDIYCAAAPTVGCADSTACNFNGAPDIADNSCNYDCLGCLDPLAVNYDPFAGIDDGSCCYGEVVMEFNMFDSFGDGWNGASYTVIIGADTVATGDLATDENGGDFDTDSWCLPASGCATVIVTNGSWPSEVSWSITAGGTTTTAAGPGTYQVGVGTECAEGCTLPFATNYQDPAELDIENNDLCDFSGVIMGCTYPDASNYGLEADGVTQIPTDQLPNVDDGSCEFNTASPCPTDLNDDGQTTTADLLIFLGAFGTDC